MYRLLRRILILLVFCMPVESLAQPRPNVTLYMPPGYTTRTANMVRAAYEEVSERLTSRLSISLPRQATIVICQSHDALEKWAGVSLPPWTVGLAVTPHYLIAIDDSRIGILHTLASVIRHETCHLYLGAWEQAHRKELPLWFNEGLSEYFSGHLHFTYAEDVMDSVAFAQFVSLNSLVDAFPKETDKAIRAYLQCRSIVDYIIRHYGANAPRRILDNYARTADFATALQQSLSVTVNELEQAWWKEVTPDRLWLWVWQLTSIFSLFSLLSFMVVIAFWRQRQCNKRLMAQWEQEEAEELLAEQEVIEWEKRQIARENIWRHRDEMME